MPAGAIPFPFGDCRICNDKATGVHYGVATCEGCKGFFKRSTTKSEKYKCFFGSQCVITPQNRNRCKYCRYKRCLEKGMAIDAVKMGRIPKIDKERALEAAQSVPGAVGRVSNDEGHLSSSDSGISDSTCQQIAERIFPMLPSAEGRVSDPRLPSESGSPDLIGRNSGTPCSVTSANSETFTLRSASGKRWHYSTELIKELLSQVMGAGNTQESVVLKKILRSLGQQHDSAERKAALQDSGIDSPESVEFQNMCKKLVSSSQRDDKSHRARSSGVQHSNNKIPVVKTEESSVPCFPDFLTSTPISSAPPYSAKNDGISDFALSLGAKRPGDGSLDGQPVAKVSTLETLLRNQFLPPSKMEDIDRFLSDALRHSGTRHEESYEDLLDNTVEPATTNASIFSPDIQRTSLGTTGHPQPSFEVPGESTGHFSHNSQLNTLSRPCAQVSYGQLPDYHSPLSSPVHSQFYPNHPVPGTCPSASSPVPSSTNSGFQNYVPPGHAYSTLSASSSRFQGNTFGFDGQPVTYSDFLLDSKNKTLPGTGSSYAVNTFHGQQGQMNMNFYSVDLDTGKRNSDSMAQYSSGSIYPSIPSPSVTSPSHVISPTIASTHLQSYESSLGDRTVDCFSHTPTKAIPVIEPSTDLCDYEPKSEDFLCYDKDLMFDGIEASSDTIDDPLLSLTELGKESLGKNKVLMERTLQRLSQADYKHNQPLRDNREWMKKFVAIKGLCRHPAGDKSQSGIQKTWNHLIGSVECVNARIIGFCNDVPGFSRLNGEDRKLMTGKAYYDIWMVTAAPFFVNGESYLQFPNGEPYTREWMTHFLKASFVDLMFDFAERLNACKLTDLEMAVLCAVQLTYPDREGIKELEEARSLHSHYLDVLDYSMAKSHPLNHSRMLIDIFNLLPVLTKINKLQEEIIANFAVDGPPGMSKETNDSDNVVTIDDLQNRFREEMTLNSKE